MGLKLKIRRIELGIKQGFAANEIGVSQQYLANLESGRSTNPSREVMLKLAKLYGCSVQELFFTEDQ
ncbi:helix-turn-helix transcriptional regulator [Cellulosilyticum lentocellum]|uniref:Helix-turn-helix domain protein n=1 Tax=Cellulosilyticum lentocellum (strain ATCC 49066 / DSM 5427 / NCIMB 11756 / RHM5) TaxID=642492 RepID=F2JJ41_CELLD|nr:helix-turn-helix transcriptional regulator [Cellulosilyticum lentocellum]ADZ83200.1 helix-turn-helix domain protein [Cellulosilyticum lentocellum DSM 5427]